jgi:hypothetical protein
VTYLFASYHEDLPRAFNDSFKKIDSGDTWYRIDFPSSQLQSADKHKIDLTRNADIGIVASEGGAIVHLGPTASDRDVRVLSGALNVDRWRTYSATMGPTRIYYRVALRANYERTVSDSSASRTAPGSLDMNIPGIFVDEIGP